MRRSTPRSAAHGASLALASALTVLACRSSSPPPPPPNDVVLPTPKGKPLPPLPKPVAEDPAVLFLPGAGFRPIGGGRRGAIVGGVRVVVDDEGARGVDRARLPDLGRYVVTSAAVGGFVVFAGESTVRLAATFDGPLVTLPAVADAEVGIGRHAVLVGPRSGRGKPRYFEAPSGRELPLPVPDAVALFGTPSGLVGTYDAKGTLFVSRNGGAFERIAGPKIHGLRSDGERLLATATNEKEYSVAANGALVPFVQAGGTMVTSDNPAVFGELPGALGSAPPPEPESERLVSPFSRIIDETALYHVRESTLFVYELRTGKLLSSSRSAFDGRENCYPIRGGVPSYVGCNAPTEMTLYRIEGADRAPKVARKFPGIYTQNFGGPPNDAPLALATTCAGNDEPGAFCVERGGSFVDEKLPPPEAAKLAALGHAVHVASSPDGEVMAFGWEGGNGALVIADLSQKKARTIAKEKLGKRASDAIRWDASSVRKGHLRFYLQDAILDVAPDDGVTVEELGGVLAAFHEKAIHVTTSGTLRESQDGGRTWVDVTSPPAGVAFDERIGCWDAGCGIGAFVRVGWTSR